MTPRRIPAWLLKIGIGELIAAPVLWLVTTYTPALGPVLVILVWTVAIAVAGHKAFEMQQRIDD